MLAGLPKAPSRSNPVRDAERALDRRNYVLRRMHGLEMISDSQYASARSAPVTAQRHKAKIQVYAPYVSEIVRKHMVERYGDLAYQSGFRVYTTIDPTYQDAANQALTTGIADRRGISTQKKSPAALNKQRHWRNSMRQCPFGPYWYFEPGETHWIS